MSDCQNVEIRELLPDYLSGTLTAARRTAVDAHLAGCTECAGELALLQLVREAYAEAPAVNVRAIAAALPRRAARRGVRSWRHDHAFQIAAAVSFVALGGISLAVVRSFFAGNAPPVVVDTAVVANSAAATGIPAISFAGGVSDLGDEDLQTLLTALESIEALPVAEPDDVPLSGIGRQGS